MTGVFSISSNSRSKATIRRPNELIDLSAHQLRMPGVARFASKLRGNAPMSAATDRISTHVVRSYAGQDIHTFLTLMRHRTIKLISPKRSVPQAEIDHPPAFPIGRPSLRQRFT